ncbi:GNAT family N-acetyltransferase [Lutimonas halocynthiae]|uniref:GNAT family N-acetyltransferase n=1 Tax=Lutimonas halocynthiae TaxID=1446477 RepID=UPI0025B565DF|nr:GNAT family N-acetyltransferase [Lutimonas halocynthiae]MDN3643334.1 GNAT family N-acetyltransferase [Lutimonas halocynthiae]
MKFRPAEIKDIEALNHISLASKRYWNYPEEWIRRWKDDLRISELDLIDLEIRVVTIDDQIKGFCAIREADSYYEVEHLWLRPDTIGKGLGKALLLASLESAVNKDLPILVEADPNAEVFYKKQGFVTYDKKESFPKGRYLPLMKMESYLRPKK